MRNSTVIAVAFILLQVGEASLQGADFAILNSSTNTANYFQQSYSPCVVTQWALGDNATQGRDEYKRYLAGWRYVLQNTPGISFEEITDGQINPTYLASFKVLVLPNNFWLDEVQASVVKTWVRQGGRLLATFGTGYQGIQVEPSQQEGAVSYSKGGTNGLHELWGDPSGKVNSSNYLVPSPTVRLQVTNSTGPTAAFPPGTVLHYWFLANLLIKRPIDFRNAHGFFNFIYYPPDDLFNSPGTMTRYPAILVNSHSKGLVVYFAFAPEYVVALARDLEGHCANDPRYGAGQNPLPGLQGTDATNQYLPIVPALETLMRDTLNFLNP